MVWSAKIHLNVHSKIITNILSLLIPGWEVSLESMFAHFLLFACFSLFWAASLHRLCKMVLSSPLRRTLRTVSSSGQRFLPSLRTRVALPLGPPPACGSCRACVLPSVTSGAYSPGFGLRPPAKAPPPQTCLAHLSLQRPMRVSARHLAG